MNYKFGKTSEEKLATVDSKLANIARKALAVSNIDFGITEGKRSVEKQKQLVEEGASKTMNSKHLSGHAIDIVCYADAFKLACKGSEIKIRWGGSWKVNDFTLNPENKFIDAVHYEIIE